MTRSHKNTLTIFSALFSCLSVLAHADMPSEMSQIHGACKSDVMKFCKGVQPGEERISKCLNSHEAELSSVCKAQGDHIKSRWESRVKKHQTEEATQNQNAAPAQQ